MTARHRQHKRFAHQALGGVSRLQQRRSNDAQVDTPRTQGFMLLVGVHLRQVDFHMRLFEPRFGDDLGQEFIHRAADETDVDRADVALGKTAGGDGGLLGTLQQVLRFDEEGAAGSGQGDAAGGAGEQLDTQVMFQQLNLSTEGRLSHVQPFGGTAEIQFGRHRGETAQLSQFEH